MTSTSMGFDASKQKWFVCEWQVIPSMFMNQMITTLKRKTYFDDSYSAQQHMKNIDDEMIQGGMIKSS